MRRLGLLAAVIAFIVDRASKLLLIELMANHPGGIRVTPFFNLVMVWNPGVSFGLFGSDSPWGRWAIVAVTLAIVVFLFVWLTRAENRREAIALGLVIGGAAGNVVDRLVWGKVADSFDFFIGDYSWPAFNTADIAIVTGVALLVLDSLWGHRQTR